VAISTQATPGVAVDRFRARATRGGAPAQNHPSRPGPAGGLSLIEGTREYLHAFADAIETRNVDSARDAILARFPDHRVRQFLDVFSLPAYFPSAANG
jgi:hypothetical protein